MLNSLHPMKGPAQPKQQTQTPGQVNYHHLQRSSKVFYHRPPVEVRGGPKKRWSKFSDMPEANTYLPFGPSSVF